MSEYPTLRTANVARQGEWDEGNKISLSFRGNELAGEVGEACNVIKKLDRELMGIKGSRDTVEHLAQELADVVICADLIASAVGINLDEAVRDKFNVTSEKHGFKTRLRASPAIGATREEIILIVLKEAYGFSDEKLADTTWLRGTHAYSIASRVADGLTAPHTRPERGKP